MLGPRPDCVYTEPLVRAVPYQLFTLQRYFAPKSLQDLERVISILKDFMAGINQREENIKQGVKVGMVRAAEDCAAGLVCMKDLFTGIGSNSSKILRWLDIDNFLSGLVDVSSDWLTKYNRTMQQSLYQALANFVEAPLAKLFDYLGNEHMRHCAPRNATSGLGTSPFKFVYYNGTKTGEKTNQTLETGDKIISGKDAYWKILTFYTTMDDSPGRARVIFFIYPIQVKKLIRSSGQETFYEFHF